VVPSFLIIPEKTPFERLRVIDKISVSALMGLINKEQLYKKLAQIEKRYTVHRWIRKLNKEGLAACLKKLSSEWFHSLEKILKKKVIIGGETSSSQ